MLKLPDGAPMGPLALDIVAELVRQGEVTEDYLYTTAGADDWRPLRELPGLPEPVFRAPRANKLKTGKADFGQLLTSSLAAAATYTALFLPFTLLTPRRHHLAEYETWIAMAVGVLVVGMIQALIAFAVFRNRHLPRIGKELLVVLLISFWFLPIIFLKALAGELHGALSCLAVIVMALITFPLPLLLCLFNRLFDRK
ncbi:MAG: DUF4339 domain-containing protein [Akkermansia sp.]|nr:DUF4339 domain-containing protein [Akkermansia sp.]